MSKNIKKMELNCEILASLIRKIGVERTKFWQYWFEGEKKWKEEIVSK
jgi:hypothetical protein